MKNLEAFTCSRIELKNEIAKAKPRTTYYIFITLLGMATLFFMIYSLDGTEYPWFEISVFFYLTIVISLAWVVFIYRAIQYESLKNLYYQRFYLGKDAE